MSATMLIANRGPVEPLHGFEVVARATRLVLVDGLNAEIDRLHERWRAADEELEMAGMDIGVRAAGIEHVAAVNIFQGPHKSLISSPIDRFPNVSVTAYATRASALNSMADHMEVPEISLLVELIVRSGPIDAGDELLHESIVHRRVERTSDALLAVVGRSRDLMNTVDSISQPRGGIVNASWTRDERTEGEAGETYVLHAARFTYALIRRVSKGYR